MSNSNILLKGKKKNDSDVYLKKSNFWINRTCFKPDRGVYPKKAGFYLKILCFYQNIFQDLIRPCPFNPSFYLKISCFYHNISQDLICPCSTNPNFYLKISCFIKISHSELDLVVLVQFCFENHSMLITNFHFCLRFDSIVLV